MKIQEFGSIWDAIEDDPAEAANLKLRSELLMALQQTVAGWEIPPAEAAKRLELEEEQLTDLRKGRINDFSLDLLTRLASRAGISIKLDVVGPAA